MPGGQSQGAKVLECQTKNKKNLGGEKEDPEEEEGCTKGHTEC